MIKYQEHYIDTPKGTIYCKEYGKGTPIVFLHGGPGLFHDYFIPHFDSLADKYRLIFFDQTGSGKSTLKDIEAKLTIDDLVIGMEFIVRYLNIKTFHCIGHSFGPLIAIKYAIKHPKALLSNIMISPAPGNDTLDKIGRQELQNRITEEDSLRMQEIMKTNPFEKEDIISINEILKIMTKGRYFDESFLEKDNRGFSLEEVYKLQVVSSKLANELDNYDYYSLLSNIKTPTLIIHGDYDPIPLESSKIYDELLQNSKLEIVKECGHFPFIEKNTIVLKNIYSLIEETAKKQ